MSQKVEKPTLQGQRLKTRKRDEKEKYDPVGFRDKILQGFIESGGDLDKLYKFIDTSGNKLDYRRYGEVLFDVFIAGGILAPGGSLSTEGDADAPYKTDVCLFNQGCTLDELKPMALLVPKFIRRYKYLERMLEDEMKKIITYLKGLQDDDRTKLSLATGLWLAMGILSPVIFVNLRQEHLVKDGLAAEFLIDVLVVWKDEKDIGAIKTSLKNCNLGSRLLEFFPPNKRNIDHFTVILKKHQLGEIVEYYKTQANNEVRKELIELLEEGIKSEGSIKELIAIVKESRERSSFSESEIVSIIWSAVMGAMDWNKKEELIEQQALRHLREHSSLFAAFTVNAKSELTLVQRCQEYCYDNMNFMKVFQKIVILFYKTDVISEEVIIKWYKVAHLSKGKSVFLDQMKKFVEWLQNAEEESDSGEDD